MFKISPINDKTLQKEYAMMCGVDSHDEFFAYSMIDEKNGELMGFSEFEIASEGGIIYSLRPRLGYEDFEAMFILGRATMNFIDLCGIHTCTATPDTAEAGLLRSLGFKESDGRFIADLNGMFDGNCKGH